MARHRPPPQIVILPVIHRVNQDVQLERQAGHAAADEGKVKALWRARMQRELDDITGGDHGSNR